MEIEHSNAELRRPAVRYVEISPDEAGQRVDNFLLGRLKGVPRSHVYRLLRKGEVRVNSGRVGAKYRLQAGDRVRIPPVRVRAGGAETAPAAGAGDLEQRIVFEDKGLLVLDKPSGIAVHGGSGLSYGVIEALRAIRPEAPYLELVHRLDRDTSGCLLVAKRRSMLRSLHQMLRAGEIEKRYLALVAGSWQMGKRRIEVPLKTHQRRGGERWVTPAAEGKAASSLFRPVDFFTGATLMEVSLETGRTHQIRVHATDCGHPVAGDQKYGEPQFNRGMTKLGLRRIFLHANAIGFNHPISGDPFQVSAPLGEDLRTVLNTLEARRG